jgi:shikimate kinase
MNSLLKRVNLYLVAMPGAGKSLVGRKLAPILGYRFIDTDEVIEQVAQKSIKELIAEKGSGVS